MSKNFFEGWYFKHQTHENTVCFIPGISSENAFIQVITDENSYNINFDKSEFHKGKIIKVANNTFSLEGLKLDIDKPEIKISGQIYYKNLTPLRNDIMGPFKFFPMQCRHGIISMHHDLSGYININNQNFDFTNGVGYIEKDSGTSFPKNYIWVQSNNFAEKCSIMVSIADIPFMGFKFKGFICSVWYEGEEYRMATYTGAKVILCTQNKIIIESRKHRLEVSILEQNGYDLYAPDMGKMTRKIRETPSCRARFKFFTKNNLIFDFESEKTSCEFVKN